MGRLPVLPSHHLIRQSPCESHWRRATGVSSTSEPLPPRSLLPSSLKICHQTVLLTPSLSSSRVNIQEVNEADWEEASSDAGSEASSQSDSDLQLAPFDPSSETFSERFYALRDIIPPSTRVSLAEKAAATVDWIKWSGGKVGGAAWVVTTSALMVGLPLLLSMEGEAGLVAQEKEYMGQQVSVTAL